MNEIRMNRENEREIVEARFRVPPLAIAAVIFGEIVGIFVLVISIIKDPFFLGFGVFMMAFSLFLLIGCIVVVKKSSCVVTNKRIYGVTHFFLAVKRYSYRLDEIDSVETFSTLGDHGISLFFSHGHAYGYQGSAAFRNGNSFRINNLANVEEMYEELTDLLTSVKNDMDVMVDIEMNKLEVESQQANAIENAAIKQYYPGAHSPKALNENVTKSNSDYIEELKRLKELLDAGIISEEEFETKKKSLLQ